MINASILAALNLDPTAGEGDVLGSIATLQQEKKDALVALQSAEKARQAAEEKNRLLTSSLPAPVTEFERKVRERMAKGKITRAAAEMAQTHQDQADAATAKPKPTRK